MCSSDLIAVDARPPGTGCGGAPALALGSGHPFEPVTDPDHPKYPILTGGQGAFHIELSLQIDGPFDPDHAALHLTLTRGDWLVSQFVNPNALLGFIDGVCTYDKIRLVLQDEQGGLLPQARTDELTTGTLHLEEIGRAHV